MNSPLVETLHDLLICYPDERVGQVVVNTSTLASGGTPQRAIEISDADWLESAIRRCESAGGAHGNADADRLAIVSLIQSNWPAGEVPLGKWLSTIALKSGPHLIHIDDQELKTILEAV